MNRQKTIQIENMEKYKRRAVYTNLSKYDPFVTEDDYIEVCEWKNGEGFDVDISSKTDVRFTLTYSEYKALKKLVKELKK